MKYTKKLLSLVLVLVLALALAVPGFAAETTSIEISNGNAGASYAAYKILNLTASQTGETSNYNYTVNPMYRNALIAVLKEGDETTLTDAQILARIAKIGDQSTEANQFANDLYLQVKTLDPDATAIGTNTFDASDGYWLIVETSTPGDGAIASKVILNTAGLADENGKITIQSKKDTIDIAKTVNDNSVDVGDDVQFTITSTVPDLTNYTDYTFIIHDTMTAGLSFKQVDSVKINGSDVDYTTPDDIDDDCDLHIQISYAVLKAAVAGQPIEIKYTATVGADAFENNSQTNDAYLEYSQNPYTTEKGNTTHKEVEVYTCKIQVNKYTDSDGNGRYDETDLKLAGAEFALYKIVDGKKYYYGLNAEETDVTWTELATENDNYEYISTNFKTYTTGEDGVVAFKGLAEGTYYLDEIKAPEDYNLPTSDTMVEVDKTASGDGDNVTYSYATVQPILNNRGTQLPSTGGMGTTIFYTLGGVLVVGAAILLVTKKRVHDVEG